MNKNIEDRIYETYARTRAEELKDYVESVCYDKAISSPIERAFFIAINAISCSQYLEAETRMGVNFGLEISPQFQIGRYRVDFLCTWHTGREEESIRRVIVECDSQQFHDRTEPERRYEKERDRYLQAQGFVVFRFTGSELLKDPFRCASEVISHVVYQNHAPAGQKTEA